MCFFDQHVYQCGDCKWGPFRQHCSREYRTGETCGMKRVMQNIHEHTKCRICEKLEIKYHRRAKEEDRIRRWKKEGGKHRRASIEASEDNIEGLNRDIERLIQERHDMQKSLGSCATEVHKEGFGFPIHPPRMAMSVPGITDLPTGYRASDSTPLSTIEKDVYDSSYMKGQGKRAHLNLEDKYSAPSDEPNVQESAHHRLKYLPTCGNLAFPTLIHGVPRSFQLPCLSSAKRPVLQDLKDARRPRNGCTNPEIGVTPRESLLPMRFFLNPANHDLGLKPNSTIDIIVLLVMQGVFDYLMQEFYVFFDQSWAVNFKSCPGSPSSSSGPDETSVNPAVDSNTSEPSTRGKKGKGGRPDEDKPEQHGNNDPKRARLDLEMGSNRFACPYFKRDPSRFGAGTQYCLHGCAGQGWKDLAKLKEHLYRAHHSFFQCPRCKIKLRSQSGLNEHSEADEICESRPRDLEDGFDLETYLYLHNKRKTCKDQTDAERWKEVFSKLFPGQPVPSPYVVTLETSNTESSATSELADMENFEAYRRREMPKRFANRATIEALKFTEPITKQLLSQVPDMIRDSEDDISRQYQGALPRADPSQFDVFQHSILPPHQEAPPSIHIQPPAPALTCQPLNSMDTQDLPASEQPSIFPPMTGPIAASLDLRPNPPLLPDPDLDSGQSCLYFCIGDCSCPSAFPGFLSAADSAAAGGDISLVLHLVRNMAGRIAALEQQQYKGRADGLFSAPASSLDRPHWTRSGMSSSASQEYSIARDAEVLHAVSRIRSSSTAIARSGNGAFGSADTGNDSLDWDAMLDIERSADHSFQ